jgi:CRISPR type III-A-associated RAMP protein Csm4
MSSYHLIRLHVETPLHLGTSRAEYDRAADYLHADTLYSAVIQAWAELGVQSPVFDPIAAPAGETLDLNLGFTLSSLFPFHGWAEGYRYFFPAPLGLLSERAGALGLSHEDQKKLKKIRFIDVALLTQLLREGPSKAMGDRISGLVSSAGSGFLSASPDGFQPFYEKQTVSRNAVPPGWDSASDTVIFYMERLAFTAGSGLFGLVHCEDDVAWQRLLTALRYLQDEGLGSDRHTGHGLFHLETAELPGELADLLTTPAQEGYRINLSLFCPSKEELPGMIKGDHVRYRLKKRGGWIGRAPYLSLRKNGVYMFEEGGIFRSDQVVAGKTVNLRPDLSSLGHDVSHPIYRVGRSLFLPINLFDHDA